MNKTLLLIPGPVPVSAPVLEAMAWPMINHRGPEFAELLARLERGMRPLFGTEKADVVFLGSSGTGGLEAAIANCFAPGDALLACPVGVFGKRLIAIAKAFGCTVDVLETEPGSGLDAAALAQKLKSDTERRYKGVLLTHNETSTGVQNDMAAYAPALRAHGALTIVDSVSGLGASDFRMDEWGYDVVVTASQKALAAPPGISAVAISRRAWERIEGNDSSRFYFDLLKAREFARKGQTPWTPPISIFYALAVALERYHAEGMPGSWERHARYAAAIRAAFEALNFRIFSAPGAHSVTVVAAVPPGGVEAANLLAALRERYGVVLSGGQGDLAGKIVRFGTMGDVGENDVLGAIASIERALADVGAASSRGAGVAAAEESFAGLTAASV